MIDGKQRGIDRHKIDVLNDGKAQNRKGNGKLFRFC